MALNVSVSDLIVIHTSFPIFAFGLYQKFELVEGMFYVDFIDPLLRKAHTTAAGLIPDGANVLDVACGSGTLALLQAEKAGHVTGIDLNPASVKMARKRAARKAYKHLEFICMDATDLSVFKEDEFDIASISMAVHQFRPEVAVSILKQMNRIAKKIIIVDYKYPLPNGLPGLITRFIEQLAGREHNNNFKSYLQKGGLYATALESGLLSNGNSPVKLSVFEIATF